MESIFEIELYLANYSYFMNLLFFVDFRFREPKVSSLNRNIIMMK